MNRQNTPFPVAMAMWEQRLLRRYGADFFSTIPVSATIYHRTNLNRQCSSNALGENYRQTKAKTILAIAIKSSL